MSDNLFVSGWNPGAFARSKARYQASGHYCTVSPERAALPPAVTLDNFILRYLNQGQAGTCWTHCGVEVAETTLGSLGDKVYPICRRLVGWDGKTFEGGGNMSDGGAVSDALQAMTTKGAGIAHEDLCPYTDDYTTLGQKPPANVWADARPHTLVSLVEVNVDPGSSDPFAEVKKLIAAGHTSGGKTAGRPVGIGIFWLDAWGPDGPVIKTAGGPGSYGHAIPIVGYAEAGVINKEECFKIMNSWGAVYPPLDPALAKKFLGWKDIGEGGKTPFFYATRSGLISVVKKGNAEFTSVTDFQGIEHDLVIPQWSIGSYV